MPFIIKNLVLEKYIEEEGVTDVVIPWPEEKIITFRSDDGETMYRKETIEYVRKIGDRAFYGCKNVTSVEIPDSVISIGNGAFAECSSLTSVRMSENVTSIGDRAFSGCAA